MPQDDLQVSAPPVTEEMVYQSRLFKELYDNPKTRGGLLKLVKDYAPNVRIPEIDTAQQVVEAVKPHVAEVTKLRDELRAEKAERDADRERHRVLGRADLGLSEADLPEIDKLVKERGIQSFETAAEFHAMSRRAAAPRSAPTSFFTLGQPDDKIDMKRLFSDPIHYTRERAHKIWDEAAAQNRGR